VFCFCCKLDYHVLFRPTIFFQNYNYGIINNRREQSNICVLDFGIKGLCCVMLCCHRIPVKSAKKTAGSASLLSLCCLFHYRVRFVSVLCISSSRAFVRFLYHHHCPDASTQCIGGVAKARPANVNTIQRVRFGDGRSRHFTALRTPCAARRPSPAACARSGNSRVSDSRPGRLRCSRSACNCCFARLQKRSCIVIDRELLRAPSVPNTTERNKSPRTTYSCSCRRTDCSCASSAREPCYSACPVTIRASKGTIERG
jgi:hypothetical protein